MGLLKKLTNSPKTSKESVDMDSVPVFTTHAEVDLKKGHKDNSKVQPPTTTSSQAIWIANSNAEAKKKTLSRWWLELQNS